MDYFILQCTVFFLGGGETIEVHTIMGVVWNDWGPIYSMFQIIFGVFTLFGFTVSFPCCEFWSCTVQVALVCRESVRR